MSHTPNYDAKVKSILDATVPGEKVCLASGRTWFMDEGEIELYRRYHVPPNPFHPDVRLKLHGAFYTAYSWWWNTDAETGEKVITHIHPKTEYKVLADKRWYARDFADLGRDVDASSSFFDQFLDLAHIVPQSAWKNIEKPENSIARISFGDQDSYFVVATQSKRSLYLENGFDVEDTMELNISNHVHHSYNVLHSNRIFDCRFVRESHDCMNSWFLFDCRNCENCFGAWNKRHAKYLWWNEQLSKGEWEKRVRELKTTSRMVLQPYIDRFQNVMALEAVWPNAFLEHCENTTGEYSENCVNCELVWACEGAKNEVRSVWTQLGSEYNAYGLFPKSNYCYDSPAAIECSRVKWGWFTTRCREVEYCIECLDCEYCFGCVGLRHKKFHLFNKSYSEENYWKKLDELKCAMLIRGEYGRFLPASFAQGPQDVTTGSFMYDDFTPREREFFQIQNYPHELESAYGDLEGKRTENIATIPDDSAGAKMDELRGRVFQCPRSGRPFTILPLELTLCRELRVPLPTVHFIERMRDLWSEMNMNEYQEIICQATGGKVLASKNKHFPDRKVFSREAYVEYLEQHG